jgi:putative copper resistance protein D
MHFGASLFAAGTATFCVLAAPDINAGLHRRLTHVLWAALALAIASGALWLLLFAAKVLEVPLAEVWHHSGVWTVAAETRFGRVACARLPLALVLGVLMMWPAARWLTLGVGVAFIVPIAAVGHAGAALGVAGDIHFVSDIIHVLAAAAWLGGLPALAILLAWARRDQRSAIAIAAVRRFSVIGMIAVAALLASGIVNSWNLLSGPSDLVATAYGELVLVKILLFAAMVAVATVNKLRLTPRLPAAAGAIQRNTLIEAGLGLAALLAVGALGTMPPPAHTHPAPAGIPQDAAFVHIHGVEAMADVTIDPGRAGPADMTVRVLREDLSELPVYGVQLALDPPLPNVPSINRLAVHQPDGTWQVKSIDLGQPGNWTVRVIVKLDDQKPIVLDGPIVIGR